MIAPGTILGGKYQVERVLGEGGMGMVVAATHIELGHRVAIKMMLPQAGEHPETLSRFEREARAAAGLASEHVARVTDVGRFDNGMPFMVMEFLEGEDLEQCIARQGLLPIGELVRYFIQACIGLHDAHTHGIVHRDVKPANIFLARRNSGRIVVKILDFGIAKAAVTTTNQSLTRTTAIMGSPQYMSPEQLSSTKTVDARTDIWSLGAAFYEAATGAHAFPAEILAELYVKIITEAPRSPRELRPDVPPALEAVLLKCLEKVQAQRYASMAEVQRDLERIDLTNYAVAEVIESTPDLLPSLARTEQGTADFAGTAAPTAQTYRDPSLPPRRSRLPLVVGVAVVAAAAALMLTRRGPPVEVSLASAPVASAPVREEAPVPSFAPAESTPSSAALPRPAAPAPPRAGAPSRPPAQRTFAPTRPAPAAAPAAVPAPVPAPVPAAAPVHAPAKAAEPEKPKVQKKASTLDPELEN